MCLGNKAPQATIWVNKQVKALWGLSKTCVDNHSLGFKSPITEVTLSTALAQLCVGRHPNTGKPSKHDLDFYATFAPPKLEFICNHDVVVTFILESGNFKSTRLDGAKPMTFDEFHCAFRLPFKQHLIVDRDHSASSHASVCKAKFLILDLKNARFIHQFSGFKGAIKPSYDDANQIQETIIHFMTNDYLPLLIRAGFHFIQSLPDFDSLSSTHLIDWSAIASNQTDILKVCGINVGMINTYLRGRWLEAAWYCEEFKGHDDQSSIERCALAQRKVTIGKFVFSVAFAPPYIRALCAKEVIIYFDLPDIQIYNAKSGTTIKWSKWKFAIVAEVVLVEEDGGMVQRLRVDFANARLCENLSSLGKKEDKDAISLEIRLLLIEHITTHYLSLLIACGADYIYYIDLRSIEEESPTQVLEKDPNDHVCITDTYGFDFVTAVTQTSVNQHLRYLFGKVEILRKYDFGDFSCDFGYPLIQLSGDSTSQKVILSLTLKNGSLTHGENKYTFANWRIAFEMRLVSETYKISDLSNSHLGGGKYDGDKHRLVLDVPNAKFRPDWSHFPGLLDELDFFAMRSKYIDLVRHSKKYLQGWVQGEDHYYPHVLYVVPSQKQYHSWGQTRFSLTAPGYQLCRLPRVGNTISSNLAGVVNCGVIVICAMINNSEHQPCFPSSPSAWTWKYSDELFHGTVVLSRSTFLDRWINKNLREINSCTTLIPKLGGVATVSDWKFSLVTLKQAMRMEESKEFEWIKDRPYDWIDHGCDATKLTFRHENHDVWSYRHTSELGNMRNGTCAISCKTENTMEIPIVYDKDGCKVRIKGLITLELTFTGEEKKWKTEACANWSWTISFLPGKPGQCLKIDVHQSPPVVSGKSGFSGDHHDIQRGFEDAPTLLKREMEEMAKDMKKCLLEEPLEDSLNRRFAGSWHLLHSGAHPYTLRSPVFNSRGDLVLGLQADYTTIAPANDRRFEYPNGNVPAPNGTVTVSPTASGKPNKKPVTGNNLGTPAPVVAAVI